MSVQQDSSSSPPAEVTPRALARFLRQSEASNSLIDLSETRPGGGGALCVALESSDECVCVCVSSV